MKATIILRLMLGLNLLLGGLVAFLHAGKRPVPPAETPATTAALPAASRSPVTVTNVSTTMVGMNWSQVETEDFPQLIARLRGASCPEHVVRAIVIGRLEAVYWNPGRSEMDWPALEPWAGRAQRQKLADAMRDQEWKQIETLSARVRELLGITYEREAYHVWREEAVIQIFMGFLADEKSLQVATSVGEAVRASQRIEQAANGIVIPDDLRRMADIGNNLLATIGRQLTPAEFNELRLRAQAVFLMESNRRFKAVDLSGEDLRRISEASFLLRDVVLDEMMHDGKEDFLTDEEKARRQAAFEQKLSTLLNPVQWQQYQLSANEDYPATVDFARKNQLPRAVADKVALAFGDARDQAADIRRDKSLTEDEKRTALAVLGATLRNTVNATLGTRADAFLQEHGQILNELVPPTPPNPK